MNFARTDRRAFEPTRHHPTDAGIDFYALDGQIIGPQSMEIVHTGIAIELPEGTMGLAKPKGRHARLIGAGVIDQDYRGEIVFRVFNTGKRNLYIGRGDPVAQIVVVPVLTSELKRTSMKKLTQTERGDTGGINGNSKEP